MRNVALLVFVCGAVLGASRPTSAPIVHPYLTEYRSEDQPPRALLDAYVEFARAALEARDLRPMLLPHAVEISTDPRPEKWREYGSDINLPFLRNGFLPTVARVRRDAEDAWLIRTATTAIFFVPTKSGAWRVYRYVDKPIE